ncbi:helix-turn-helix domain-containing protein [Streptomyces sp. NPDC002215]|uniref:helix-turn-helix domain-containing protein n=1 Tax=Streptomyces sp. NPDC002215 TaxID=3154412 RepID=UPI00333072BF
MSARFLYRSVGVRLTPQQRSELHLTSSEREEISRGIAAGESARQLARRLCQVERVLEGVSRFDAFRLRW